MWPVSVSNGWASGRASRCKNSWSNNLWPNQVIKPHTEFTGQSNTNLDNSNTMLIWQM